jgi:hypothetical protein
MDDLQKISDLRNPAFWLVLKWVKLKTKKSSPVLKVETDIITSITASPMGRVTKLVIMYIETFKTDIIVFYR